MRAIPLPRQAHGPVRAALWGCALIMVAACSPLPNQASRGSAADAPVLLPIDTLLAAAAETEGGASAAQGEALAARAARLRARAAQLRGPVVAPDPRPAG